MLPPSLVVSDCTASQPRRQYSSGIRAALFTMAPQSVMQSHQKGKTGVPNNFRNKHPVTCKKNFISTQNKGALDGKEVIRVVEYDGKIRELVVPSKQPTVPHLLLDTDELNRLKQQAKVITQQDRLAEAQQAYKKKNQLTEECMARKDEMRKQSEKQLHEQKHSLLESDAHQHATHLLRRAFELKQEQEDEVKTANRLIMSTKCHAIRDAQIVEKKQIKKELEDEERRLDQMMEDERRRALRAEEERDEKEQIKKIQYMKQIQDQITQSENKQILQLKCKEEESRLISEIQMQIKLDEQEAYKRKLAEQKQTRDKLNEINSQIEHFHKMQMEEDRINDMKIQAYMRLKAERGAARQKEQEAQQMAREREIARLRALQQHQCDLQAEMDERNALRIQDKLEREFRNREREAMRKKKDDDARMKKAREEQILDRRRVEALEIAREKQAFEQVLKMQKDATEKQRLDDLRKQRILQQYRSDIIRQIKEKQSEKTKEKQSRYEEGVALKMKEVQRERYIKQVMQKKVEELRAHKIPEVYVKDVERQLNLG